LRYIAKHLFLYSYILRPCQELEANRYGTALAVASNYSPAGILQLLDEFDRLERKGVTVNEAAKYLSKPLRTTFAVIHRPLNESSRSRFWQDPSIGRRHPCNPSFSGSLNLSADLSQERLYTRRKGDRGIEEMRREWS
jgi:hypothetical protein